MDTRAATLKGWVAGGTTDLVHYILWARHGDCTHCSGLVFILNNYCRHGWIFLFFFIPSVKRSQLQYGRHRRRCRILDDLSRRPTPRTIYSRGSISLLNLAGTKGLQVLLMTLLAIFGPIASLRSKERATLCLLSCLFFILILFLLNVWLCLRSI